MGIITYKKKSGAGFDNYKYKKPSKTEFSREILRHFKSYDRQKFKEYFGKFGGGKSITSLAGRILKEGSSRDKSKFLKGVKAHYAPPQEDLAPEEKARNIKLTGGMDYTKKYIEEGVGSRERAAALERGKFGILSERVTKANLTPGSGGKEETHSVGALAPKPSGSALAGKSGPSISVGSVKTAGTVAGSPGSKSRESFKTNRPPTLPNNKPPTIIPFSK